jgi:hypothetical protein
MPGYDSGLVTLMSGFVIIGKNGLINKIEYRESI